MNEARIDAHLDARLLISRGMRVPIIARITDLSPNVVRRIYREITGEFPKPGPIPSIMSLLATNVGRAGTAVFLSLYEQYAPKAVERMQVDWRAVLLAYDTFQRVTPERFHTLDINGAWRAATGYRSGELCLQVCGQCQTAYVTCDTYDRRPFRRCAICSLVKVQTKKEQQEKPITA